MKLYEINDEIMACIDTETGEILDEEKFNELHMAKEEKLTNIALLYINMKADKEAYETQEKKFKAAKERAKNTMEWCKNTLANELQGKPMKDDERRFTIGWRNSEKLIITDEKAIAPEWVVTKTSFDVAGMKEAIKNGQAVAGAEIISNQNIQIK